MCCMFEKEIENLEDNEDNEEKEEKEEIEKMIKQGIDVSLVKIIKKRRNHQDDSDLDNDDKRIIKQHYGNLRGSEKVTIIFELLRDCGDATTVAKVLDFLVNECHCHEEALNEVDKHKVHKEIIRPLHQKPELKAWVIEKLGHGKPGRCETFCLCLNKPWLNFKRNFLPYASYLIRLISFHLDYWKDLVVFFALRHYCTFVLVSST